MTATGTYSDSPALMQGDRDQLTHLLRGLAARLDQLDRRLADLAWHGSAPRIGAAVGELVCESSALESERERLTDRLTVLAGQLNTMDNDMSSGGCLRQPVTARVGTCPYCGYPSLASGLCAFCRPHLAR